MKNSDLGYDDLFKKLNEDGFYGTISFRLVDGKVMLLKYESTYKNVQDAIVGKTTSD